jgi:hypothetical protein
MKIRTGHTEPENTPRTHNQHYVPRMHLKRFAAPGHPTTVFVYDKRWKATRTGTIRGQAYDKERTMWTGMSIVQRVAKAILGMPWALLQSGASDLFILGDTPVFSCAPRAAAKTPVGLLTAGAETTIPVSSQACLLLTAGTSPPFASKAATQDQVREVNVRSAHSSRRRFFGAESRQDWLDLANQNDEWDETVEFFSAPNLDIALSLVENHCLRPIFP